MAGGSLAGRSVGSVNRSRARHSLARSPFNQGSDFRNALAQIAGFCQLLVVNAWRVRSRCGARAKPSSAADHDHLINEHGGTNSQHGDLFAIGDPSASRKSAPDLIAHLAFAEQVELGLESPAVKKGLHFAGHIAEIDR